MKILSINTTGVGTQIALRLNEEVYYVDAGFSRHSESLFPMMEDLLDKHNTIIDDLDYVGVVIGPGSFTGIRIGMSVAKAFCYVKYIPCVAVNSLEVLAYNTFDFTDCKVGEQICSTVNAGAGNLYQQIFEVENVDKKVLKKLTEPDVSKIEHFEGLIKNVYPNCKIFYNASNERTRQLPNIDIVEQKFTPNALDNCILETIRENKTLDEKMVAPLYIRQSQAENVTIIDEKELNFKECLLDDLATIMELESQGDAEDLPWTEQSIRDSFENNSAKSFILRKKDLPLGYLTYLDLKGQYEIERIVVFKNARLQGVGEHLLGHLIELANKNNINEILLEVNNKNYPAIRLYKKFGWEQTGERKNYYGNGKNAILMTRKI